MHHPIQTANVLLMVVGVALFCAGPYIIYRTVQGVAKEQRKFPNSGEVINGIIGILFFGAGILFVVNNLRGNPLA